MAQARGESFLAALLAALVAASGAAPPVLADCDCGGMDSRGDSDCLGDAPSAYDIDHFIQAVGTPADRLAAHACDLFCANDINCDGEVNAYDIDGFVTCVGQSGCDPCP